MLINYVIKSNHKSMCMCNYNLFTNVYCCMIIIIYNMNILEINSSSLYIYIYSFMFLTYLTLCINCLLIIDLKMNLYLINHQINV